MRSKRFLAMLLALCMVLSVFSPAAMAVEAGADTVVTLTPEEGSDNKASSKENDLLISPDNAENHKPLNMRDDPLYQMEVNNDNAEGHWEITPSGKPQISLTPEVPACLEELKKAAEFYSAEETVKAFVVMEDAPLAESTRSISLASASAQKLLLEKQDSVISAIEKTVLNGQELNVRYQFTYLTNAFTVEIAFANLEKIAVMPGVKSVFVMPVFETVPTEAAADPLTAASGEMTGVHNVWAELGFTGQGMKIAIIDTGLDLDHPSFAAAPAGADMDVTDIQKVLADLNIYKRLNGNLKAEDLYRSEKVPFAFNYVDGNLSADHSRDGQGDHGTHVAGIAAANKTEGTSVVGMAPDAQVIVMKVFGAGGGAYTDDFVAAIEDAMTLGCDVVNLSLGSPAGFSESGYEEYDAIFERLATQNIIATISAGNETNSSYGNMWGTDMNRTQNPENGVVGSPSTYANSFSIASADNSVVMTSYLAMADGTKIFYQPDISYLYGYAYGIDVYTGMTFDYVVVDGLGNVEDFYDADGNSLVEGKIAIIKRGELAFGLKVQNAADAGAVAAIIWNTNDTDDIFTFGMNTQLEDQSYPTIPSVLITLSDGQTLADAETKTLTIPEGLAERPTVGGQMSSFSSWGTTSDLRLVPDITGVGGNVYSTLDGGAYGVMSGTSMSAPQVAGISALVMQHLHEKFPDAAEGEIREMALALMMSTADPIHENQYIGMEASPRQQGAGLVNVYDAITSTTYLTVDGGRPKVELGDSSTGVYTLSFEVHNFGDTDKTYYLHSSLLAEYVSALQISATEYEYFMAGFDMPITGNVYFDTGDDTVTIPAGETVEVTVSITLSSDSKEYFETYWENGSYVEGYLYLCNEEGEAELNLPFLGFYGDWTEAPVFDTADWYDNSFWGIDPANGLPEGDQYYNVVWTTLAGTDWVLGMNPYSGAMVDENGNVIYDPANNVVSPNGDGILDGIDELYLSLLRNVKYLTFTYTVDGEVMFRETAINNMKTMYISAYGQIVPWIGSWYPGLFYDFTDAEGNVLPSGTEVLLTIEAQIDYGTGGENVMEIPFVVDTTYPELLNVYEAPLFGNNFLTVDVADNHNIASVVLLNASGTQVLGQCIDLEAQEMEDGIERYSFDITGMGTEFVVAVCDYAGNESYYTVEYNADPSGNLPVMDTTKLYAYRVNDSIIGQYYGYDQQFGWVSLAKPVEGDEYIWVDQENSDANEYYALTAAEFVDGKIFAVDAGYNFLVMDPGLWNRQTVVNLGVGALDMAFDDVTDTMYLLGKDGNYTTLYSIDLLTGELTELKYYGYYNYAPYAITVADDGTIYAIKYNNSNYTKYNLYTLDAANGYAMVPVTNAAGEQLAFTGADGNPLKPNYAQSMTYSDGIIYWTYFNSSYWGNVANLVVIDTENDYTWSIYDLATAYPELGGSAISDTEMIGLLTLDETDYEIPASDTLNSILLETNRVVLPLGETTSVKAYPLPWNYELDALTWTSSDETVAVVNEKGVVAGVGEGNATITVSYNGLEASYLITVVALDGDFYAYDYFNASGDYGDIFHYDLETGEYTVLGYSPLDFLAAEYNGHDGYYYGYTEGGQFWRLDLTNGEYVALGTPVSMTPTDMAYDYSTGMMYAITVDYYSGLSTVCGVNLKTGELVPMGDALMLMTLACDLEGNLYAVNAEGNLYKITFEDGELVTETLMTGLGNLNYAQSMCYDFENDVLLWANPETANIFWIDFKNEAPYTVALGDPTNSGMFEFMGMFNIPAEIPELQDVAVESIEAQDMMLLTGYNKLPSYMILPLNATCQDVTWTSSNEAVVKVEEDGSLTGIGDGVATITGTLVDTVSGETLTVTFNVTVLTAADNIFGHVMTDVATYNGQFWVELNPGDTANPEVLGMSDYTIYAEEYYNGKLYAVGFDPYDWEGNWQLFIMDPDTYVIEEQMDLGEGYPFVYDMTYDYNTSTMYCVAGPSSTATDLYIMNMETGALVPFMATEEFFMSLAAGPDGKLYAIEQSQMVIDYEYYTVTYAPANLYTIDPLTQEIELVGSTGVASNMIASMAYDYDTNKLYWTALLQDQMYGTITGGLHMVDPVTAKAVNLGTLGIAGMQVGGLYILSEEYPEEIDRLNNVVIVDTMVQLGVGDTAELETMVLPAHLDVELVWSSSDEAVATVENGVVTAVAQGSATITATATYDGVTKSASCKVIVLNADAGFLTYNVTDGGWALISRHDQTVVTNLTEGEDEAEVNAVVTVGDTVYGVDVNNSFFKLDLTTFERTEIAKLAVTLDEEMGYDSFEIVDLEYDVKNDRVLALGNMYSSIEGEMYYGRSIYELDLETGALTELYNFGYEIYIMAMAVDGDGIIYYYTCYDDNVYSMDLETETATALVSMQTQSLYGDYESDQSMYYDHLTETIYMVTTGNGTFYRMATIDPVLGKLTLLGDVGEVVELDSWTYQGDYFAGMTFVEIPEKDPADYVDFISADLSLDGMIGLNFYADVCDELINDADAYAQFSIEGTDKKQTVLLSELEISNDGKYIFTYKLPAKNLTDVVTVTVFNGAGEAVGETLTYSAKQYCDTMKGIINGMTDPSAFDDLVDLMNALLNYGAAAQVQFGYNVENLVNAELSAEDKLLPENIDLSAYAHTKTGAAEGLTVTSAMLQLEAQTVIRVYFTLDEGKSIEDYDFFVDGVAVTPVAEGGQYYIEKSDIAAKNLDKFYTFQMGDVTLTYCGLSYAKTVLDNSHIFGEELQNMVKALYAYNQAANAYFE